MAESGYPRVAGPVDPDIPCLSIVLIVKKAKLLSAQIWLTDIGTWAQMNEIWTAWIDPANPPARATVEANLAVPGLSIEIMVTAAL